MKFLNDPDKIGTIFIIIFVTFAGCVPTSILLDKKENAVYSKSSKIKRALSEIKSVNQEYNKHDTSEVIKKRGVDLNDFDAIEMKNTAPKGQWIDKLPFYLFDNGDDETLEPFDQFSDENTQFMPFEFSYRGNNNRKKRSIINKARVFRFKRDHAPSEIVSILEMLRENELNNNNRYSSKIQQFSSIDGYGRLNKYPNSLLASSDKYNSMEDTDENWGPPVDRSVYAELPFDLSLTDPPVYGSYKKGGSKRFMVSKKKRSLAGTSLKNNFQKSNF